MVLAIPQAIVHWHAFHLFTEGLHEHGQKLVEWERMVWEWKDDHAKPSPYKLPEMCKLLLPLIPWHLPDS